MKIARGIEVYSSECVDTYAHHKVDGEREHYQVQNGVGVAIGAGAGSEMKQHGSKHFMLKRLLTAISFLHRRSIVWAEHTGLHSSVALNIYAAVYFLAIAEYTGKRERRSRSLRGPKNGTCMDLVSYRHRSEILRILN